MKSTLQQRTRAVDLTELLGSAPDPSDHDAVCAYIHRLADCGLSLLLIAPGGKLPFDGRAVRTRLAEDKAAQEEAKAAGVRGWAKVKSSSGIYLATGDKAVLDGHLTRYIETFGAETAVNVAVAVGLSRLVVVDCDTREQVAAFLSDAGRDPDTPPTVSSPGSKNHEGQWIHSDGGHFWFVVPDGVELPDNTASYTDADGEYAVMWGMKYVLIPPSVRAEGRYTPTGQVAELPDWLQARIIDRPPGQPRGYDRAAAVAGKLTPIDEWSRSIEWGEILEPRGWVATGHLDSCGCPTWTAPGQHTNPKSATGHEPGCSSAHYNADNPPLHIWTDHPGEPFQSYTARTRRTTLSKLETVALIDFDGKVGDAMGALGLIPDPETLGGGGSGTSANLPEEFWTAYPVLKHIRDAAHHGVNSADAVIGTALARISVYLDPSVKVDTGIKSPMPLNMFAGLVGSAGTGKSSAYAAAADLLAFVLPDPLTDLRASEVPRELPVGTGPGVAEAFMGTTVDPLDPKGPKRREQVAHKLLLHCDEGASLVAGIIDNKRGQDIGPTLRQAWSGEVLGQANASADRKREVRDYTLGLVVNFQLEALAALSTPEQMEYGTPQRFVYFSATDPSIPYDAPPDPGRLTVKLPSEGLHYCDELKAQVRREAVERSRGHASGSGNPMEVHRPAMRARLAALLVILCDPGRTVIYPDDVALADMILDTSARIHDTAVEWRRERESAERERQTQRRINEHVAMTVAVDNKDATVQGLKVRIRKYVTDAGGKAEWTGKKGLRQKFKSTERPLADEAKTGMVAAGELTSDGDNEVSLP